MKYSMFVFDLQGNVSMECPYVSVYRQGPMLVLRFLNNLYIPFRVRRGAFGEYKMYISDTPLFELPSERSAITITVNSFGSTSIHFDLLAGYSARNKCELIAGFKIKIENFVFLESSVMHWASGLGVAPPMGCVYTTDRATIERGCKLEKTENAFIVGFPNGLKLPIMITGAGFVVLGRTIPLVSSAFLGVTVHSYCKEYVRFLVSIYEHDNLTLMDDIVYDETGARYGEYFVSAVTITKQLVLRV